MHMPSQQEKNIPLMRDCHLLMMTDNTHITFEGESHG